MVSCFSSSSSCVEDYIAIIKTSHGYIKLGPQKPVVEPTTLGCVSSSQEKNKNVEMKHTYGASAPTL
jgi:hypothetical protein